MGEKLVVARRTNPEPVDSRTLVVPRRRTKNAVTNAEAILPRSLDPMYQGMRRENTRAKGALFANYRAEVSLRRSLNTYTNICREHVLNIRHDQRKLCRDYGQIQRRRQSIERVRSAPPPSRDYRKWSYAEKRPVSSVSTLVTSDDEDVGIRMVRSATQRRPVGTPTPPRPHTSPFFLTEVRNAEVQTWKPIRYHRKREKTAMDLIRESKPLPVNPDDEEDIDYDRLRTSSYYRRVTSPSLKGVVSNELAVYFRKMQIKV